MLLLSTIPDEMPVSPSDEAVLTVDELAQQFHVSKKTLARWREWGLIGQWSFFNGRRRIGFSQSSVDRFMADNAERVHRGARFSQLTVDQRQEIFERAHCLAQAGGRPGEVGMQIARETGRSEETIRYTLKRYDLEHPETAIFPYNHGPLRSETKRQIFQLYCRGESAEALAGRFQQTRTRIHRIINEARVARIMTLPLDSMGNEQFACLGTGQKDLEFLRSPPESDPTSKKTSVPSGMPTYLANLYDVPLLTRQQEAKLFWKMNYLKYKANGLRDTLDVNRPKSRLMDQIERLCDESVATKNQIIRANLRLVVSIAKRYIDRSEDFFDLVSDGNISLMRAAEKFDVSLGYRFSTYASWAIMKNFARTIPAEFRRQDRFSTSHSEIFNTIEDIRTDQFEQESAQARSKLRVQKLLGLLDEREKRIITSRFGLAGGQEPLTLKQVGTMMGVTKERVRQIQSRTLSKLKRTADED